VTAPIVRFSLFPDLTQCLLAKKLIKDGFVFVRQQEGFLCFDAHGQKAFEV
jgi:hypothetical protein